MLVKSLCLAACALLPVAARAGLEWAQTVQEFHCLPNENRVEAHFAFKNTGPTPVTIRTVKSSCGCTVPHLEKKTYAPGESGEIGATYTFRWQSGLLRRLVTVTTDDAPEKPVPLEIRVCVQEPFEVKPALVLWRMGEPAEAKSITLQAKGRKVGIRGVSSSNPRISATLQTVAEGEQYAVAIRPEDTAQKEGAEVTITTDYPANSPRTYTVHARIK